MDRLRFLFASTLILMLTGCTTTVQLTPQGYSLDSPPPTSNSDVNAGYYIWKRSEYDSFLTFYFSTSNKLNALSEKYTHHLYYSLRPCGQASSVWEKLYGGAVFTAESDIHVTSEHVKTNSALYKIYLPLKIDMINDYMNGIMSDDEIPAYLKYAYTKPLCIGLGGATMGFRGLKSNRINVPIIVDKNSIELP